MSSVRSVRHTEQLRVNAASGDGGGHAETPASKKKSTDRQTEGEEQQWMSSRTLFSFPTNQRELKVSGSQKQHVCVLRAKVKGQTCSNVRGSRSQTLVSVSQLNIDLKRRLKITECEVLAACVDERMRRRGVSRCLSRLSCRTQNERNHKQKSVGKENAVGSSCCSSSSSSSVCLQ